MNIFKGMTLDHFAGIIRNGDGILNIGWNGYKIVVLCEEAYFDALRIVHNIDKELIVDKGGGKYEVDVSDNIALCFFKSQTDSSSNVYPDNSEIHLDLTSLPGHQTNTADDSRK